MLIAALETPNPVLPHAFDLLWALVPAVVVIGLGALLIGAFVSISRRSAQMTGLELIGWTAFVVFAQVIGPLVWFWLGRDRYPALSVPQRSARAREANIR